MCWLGSCWKQNGQIVLDSICCTLHWPYIEEHCKIPKIAKTLERAIQLIGYIYNYGGVINIIREYTNQRELVRVGKTRFCTSHFTI